MLFCNIFSKNSDNIYDDLYVEVDVKITHNKKGYNPHAKDSKKRTLARNKARATKYARRSI